MRREVVLTGISEQESLAINLSDVLFQYDTTKNNAVFIATNWTLQRGEKIFIQGASGSGKSTLLNLLAGVLEPQKGEVSLLNQPFSVLPAKKRDKFRAEHIGVVFQQFNLIPFLTVLQNVQVAAYFGTSQVSSVETKLSSLLEKLSLPLSVLHQKASELSVGQQQRVAIARALINEPEILLVDEPTSALDSAARDAFMEVLLELCEINNTTLIFVSHDQYLQHCFNTVLNIEEVLQRGLS